MLYFHGLEELDFTLTAACEQPGAPRIAIKKLNEFTTRSSESTGNARLCWCDPVHSGKQNQRNCQKIPDQAVNVYILPVVLCLFFSQLWSNNQYEFIQECGFFRTRIGQLLAQ